MTGDKPRSVRAAVWPIDGTMRYDAVCDDCQWTCHVTPHKDEQVAARCLTRHVLNHHARQDWLNMGKEWV